MSSVANDVLCDGRKTPGRHPIWRWLRTQSARGICDGPPGPGLPLRLLNDLIRPQQHRLRDREAERRRGLAVEDGVLKSGFLQITAAAFGALRHVAVGDARLLGVPVGSARDSRAGVVDVSPSSRFLALPVERCLGPVHVRDLP